MSSTCWFPTPLPKILFQNANQILRNNKKTFPKKFWTKPPTPPPFSLPIRSSHFIAILGYPTNAPEEIAGLVRGLLTPEISWRGVAGGDPKISMIILSHHHLARLNGRGSIAQHRGQSFGFSSQQILKAADWWVPGWSKTIINMCWGLNSHCFPMVRMLINLIVGVYIPIKKGFHLFSTNGKLVVWGPVVWGPRIGDPIGIQTTGPQTTNLPSIENSRGIK